MLDDFEGGSMAGDDQRKKGTMNMTHYNDKYGVDRFRRFSRYATLGYGLYLLHDGVSYARLAIGPLWEEILRQMMPAAKTKTAASATAANDNTTFPRLVIFSGHDSTLETLLASLGGDLWDGTQWAEYASMMIMCTSLMTMSTNSSCSLAYMSVVICLMSL